MSARTEAHAVQGDRPPGDGATTAALAAALLLVATTVVLAAGCLAEPGDAGDVRDGATDGGATVSFHDGGEELARFQVAVADTPAARRRGLMGRETLAADEGMLFVYDDEARRRFWMRNTTVPLDVVFVDTDRRVVHVAHAAPPEPGTPVKALERYGDVPAQYVVEVPRGTANRTGIAPGAELRLHGVDTGSGG